MIGSAGVGSGFVGLTNYLLRGDDDRSAERVAWTAVRNLPSENPELAPRIMRATADQNTRVKSPVYHLSISAPRDESFTPEQWQQIADRVLKDLGLEEHQALIVAHRDTPSEHLHVMVNRVHPERLRVWKPSHDYPKIERSLRRLEREWGLREVPGRHYQLDGQERPEKTREHTRGERHQAERTGKEVWADRVRFQLRRDFQEAKNWGELERALARNGLRMERRGGGLVVTDGRRRVKASRIHRGSSYARLTERFGLRFEDWRQQRRELLDVVDRHQQTEKLRPYLMLQRDRARGAVQDARSEIEDRDRVRRATRDNAAEIRRGLRQIYKPDEVLAVERRLVRRAREVGWRRAGREIAEHPQRFGRLRLGRIARLRRPVRRRLRNWVWHVGQTARERAALLPMRAANGPRGFQAAQGLSTLLHILSKAQARLDRQPSRKVRLHDVASRAAALGLDAVKLVIAPNPWSVVRGATRALRLARDLARGVDRGMEM